MTISIFTTDEQLLVRSWDSQLESMRGLDAESVYGCPLTEIIPDLESRGLLARFNQVLEDGTIQTLAPDFHHYLIKCPPRKPSKYFDSMQQRVTIAPLREKTAIVGLVITLEDVTERMEAEWELANARTLSNSEPEEIDSDTSVHESLIAALADDRWQVRQNATRHLTNVKAPELNAQLLQLLRQQHHNPNILNSVIQVLTLTQVDIVPALIDCLKEEDSDLRIYVVQTLGQRKDPRAVSVLIEMLDDENVNVRYHAIEALGKLQALEAVDSLVKIAESEDFFLAFPALDALMQMVNAKLAPQLVPLLQKTLNWQLRREAVDNLAITDDPEIIRSLLRLMREQHRNPNVLNATLQILALSNVDPIPALVECLGEPDPDLRIYTA
ncbi:HEAT repeat domain-containing protein, partial [Limnoraphis robusta]|nr:HEAT repeat domain-containing protein [Limnoraphis robusta]